MLEGRVAYLLILNLHFVCRVSQCGDLPPIWEAVDRGKGSTEGLSILNQTLMRGHLSCCRIFGGRYPFIYYSPLIAFVKNFFL